MLEPIPFAGYVEIPNELTDAEIAKIRDEFLSPTGCDIYTFARAILRKAQEND